MAISLKIRKYLEQFTNNTSIYFDSTGRLIISKLDKNIIDQCISQTVNYRGNNLKERLYWAAMGMNAYPECIHCSKEITKFSRYDGKPYPDFCSKLCHLQSKSRKDQLQHIWKNKTGDEKEKSLEKLKSTNRQRYGVDFYQQTDEFLVKQAKTKKTKDPTWGTKLENKVKISNAEKQENRRKTCMEKYGVDHYSKTNEFKIKFKQTSIARYGFDNPNKAKIIRDKLSETRKNNWLPNRLEEIKKQGFTPVFENNEYTTVDKKYKWKCLTCQGITIDDIDDGRNPRCYVCDPYSNSLAQQELYSLVYDMGFSARINDRTVLNGLEIDVYIEDFKLGLEYHGLYWHGESQNIANRNRHSEKYLKSKELGITLFQIYENEWRDKKDLVRSMISNKLGLSERIMARKTKIAVVSFNDSRVFLQENHIQGYAISSINLGLYHDNKLVSLMTFAKSRYEKNVEYELIRFANAKYTVVVGGASKLFKYFIKTYKPKNIVSFSDNRFSQGNLYRLLGFKFEGDNNKGYMYFKDGSVYNREQFQKHKLKDKLLNFAEQLSEWENMKNNGYDRIWDAGQSKWCYYQ